MSLAIGQNPKLNHKRPQAVFEEKKKTYQSMTLQTVFAGIVLLNPSGVSQLTT